LALVTQTQRGAMRNRQRLIVHLIGENGLRMVGAIKADAFVIFVAGEVHRVGTIEHHVTCLGMRTDKVEQ